MTAHALMYVDKATFYRFIATADEAHRHEFVRGWIMQQQAGGTRRHSEIGLKIAILLSIALDPTVWVVTGPDRLTDTGPTVRYGDVTVERRDSGDDASVATEHPSLIVEVLSPSSEERDLSVKPHEYMSLPSLQAYIVASQDEPLCYVWVRGATGAFPPDPAVIKGRDTTIDITTLGVAIRLADVYRTF